MRGGPGVILLLTCLRNHEAPARRSLVWIQTKQSPSSSHSSTGDFAGPFQSHPRALSLPVKQCFSRCGPPSGSASTGDGPMDRPAGVLSGPMSGLNSETGSPGVCRAEPCMPPCRTPTLRSTGLRNCCGGDCCDSSQCLRLLPWEMWCWGHFQTLCSVHGTGALSFSSRKYAICSLRFCYLTCSNLSFQRFS